MLSNVWLDDCGETGKIIERKSSKAKNLVGIPFFLMNREQKIELMLKCLESLLGTPYKFGGNVPQDGGIDCSGFVLEGLRSIGEWGLSDATSQMIYNNFVKRDGAYSVNNIERGDLLFFGKSQKEITHVAIAYNKNFMIEAGGNNTNGMVRIRPITWRSDKVAAIRGIH